MAQRTEAVTVAWREGVQRGRVVVQRGVKGRVETSMAQMVNGN